MNIPKQYKVAEQRLGIARKALQKIAEGGYDDGDNEVDRRVSLMLIAEYALKQMDEIKIVDEGE